MASKLHLLYLIPLSFTNAVITTLSTLFSTGLQERPFKKVFGVNLLRELSNNIPYELFRSLRPSTAIAIRDYCTKHKLDHRVVSIPCKGHSEEAKIPDAVLHLSNAGQHQLESHEVDDDKRTLFYLHGGGYINPIAGDAHLPLVQRLAAAAHVSRVAILEYSLAPEWPYPVQLTQAIYALEHLLAPSPAGISLSSSDIIVAGDSAGGNLLMGLLTHIARPSPYGPLIERKVGDRFRAAVLISPWISWNYSSQSFTKNAAVDYLTRDKMEEFTGLWRPKGNDIWAIPLGAIEPRESFWRDVFQGKGRVSDRTLVAVGMDEVFLDDVSAMAIKMGADSDGATSAVSFAKCPGEPHVGAAIDQALGVSGGSMIKVLEEWLTSL